VTETGTVRCVSVTTLECVSVTSYVSISECDCVTETGTVRCVSVTTKVACISQAVKKGAHNMLECVTVTPH